MEENDMHKNEVQRLNRIIDILINNIAILKGENDILKKAHSMGTAGNAISGNAHSMNSGQMPMPENMDSMKSGRMPMSENMDGINSDGRPMSENMDGMNSGKGPISENMDGINSGFHAISEIEQRIKSAVYGMPQTAPPPAPVKTPVQKVVPAHIVVDDDAMYTLAAHLRKVFHVRTTEGKLLNVARELLFLHNNGKGTGRDLRREARLSKPGFAKHLPTLHRHGLIERGEKRTYHLTSLAKHLIFKGFAE